MWPTNSNVFQEHCVGLKKKKTHTKKTPQKTFVDILEPVGTLCVTSVYVHRMG